MFKPKSNRHPVQTYSSVDLARQVLLNFGIKEKVIDETLKLLSDVDPNQPLYYEPTEDRNFNNLQDAGGARSHCKEREGIDIGQPMDRRERRPNPSRIVSNLQPPP